MSTTSNPYRGFRYPAEIINQAVWLYHCFSLSLREVELILAARGIIVSYETIREWSLRFGRTFAKTLRRRRPQPGDKWFLDEVFVRIRGKLHGSVATPDIGQTEARQGRWLRGCTEQGGNEASLSAHVIR
jgi:putative transposase